MRCRTSLFDYVRSSLDDATPSLSGATGHEDQCRLSLTGRGVRLTNHDLARRGGSFLAGQGQRRSMSRRHGRARALTFEAAE